MEAEREEFLPLIGSVSTERASFLLRFESAHIRCPNCDNPIEVVFVSDATDVYCPSCRSTFRLERESESTVESLDR